MKLLTINPFCQQLFFPVNLSLDTGKNVQCVPQQASKTFCNYQRTYEIKCLILKVFKKDAFFEVQTPLPY
jgi:hypothetical protein